jgi:NAD(P)-dependent dehydrogenase (short-subunit alcohol dehydrogenase family)
MSNEPNGKLALVTGRGSEIDRAVVEALIGLSKVAGLL